jgi:hypothetical protein
MRCVLIACVALALALPAAATATSMPPWNGITWIDLPAAKQHKNASCSEQGRTARVQRVARRLAPVACEQPPRPKLRNAITAWFFGP